MDDVEPFRLFQKGGQVREGVKVEAAVWHKIRGEVQSNVCEGVMRLSGPTSCAAWTALDVVIFEDKVSDPEAQGKALRRPHSARQTVQRRGCVIKAGALPLCGRVLAPRCNACQDI